MEGQFASVGHVVEVDLKNETDEYLAGNVRDGEVTFPEAGYLVLAWKTLAKIRGESFRRMPVIFLGVRFHKVVALSVEEATRFTVNIFEGSGHFEVSVKAATVASGKIVAPEMAAGEFLDFPETTAAEDCLLLPLSTDDVYKEFRLQGYDCGGVFRGVLECDGLSRGGKLQWNGNWTSFLQSVFQFATLDRETRKLQKIETLRRAVIDPDLHERLERGGAIDVKINSDCETTRSGGVELSGITTKLIQRCQRPTGQAVLEKYVFLPYRNETPSAADGETATLNAITSLLQIVMENSATRKTDFEMVMVAGEKPASAVLSEAIEGFLARQSPLSLKRRVVAREALIESAITGEGANLIVIADTCHLEKADLLRNASASLKIGGFVFLEEGGHFASEAGLIVVSSQAARGKTYVLLRKPAEIPRDSIAIDVTERDFSWVEAVKDAMRRSAAEGTKVYLVTRGERLTGLVGLANCLRKEIGGGNVRSFFLQDSAAEKFSPASERYREQVEKDLLHNVLIDGVWGSYRFLILDRGEDAIQVEHAYVDFSGELNRFRWLEGPPIYSNEELYAVHSASLDSKVITSAIDERGAYVEFSGENSKGRRVMGIANARGVASSTVRADPHFLWDMPKNWSFEEAATVPSSYALCCYALFLQGRLTPEETILIHAGNGSVGMAATRLALQVGCTVFATVDGPIGRDLLLKTFPGLNDRHIEEKQRFIVQRPDRWGVDLVLMESDYDDGDDDVLRASIDCLADGGRLLVIGGGPKQQATSGNVSKNFSVHYVSPDSLFRCGNAFDRRKIGGLIEEGLEKGAVRPLPAIVFDESRTDEAFRFARKHVGKVVLRVRDERGSPSRKTIGAAPRAYMNPQKSYVLVGGLGGVGLELAEWLIKRGATKLVLNSRSGIKAGYQSNCVRRWCESDIDVLISLSRADDEDGVKKLLQEAEELGPVGGIFNLAALLRDATIRNQSEANFKTVCDPKITTSKLLDAASRALTPKLDHFVLFSSVSSGFGNAGQANYGFANSAMERICEARQGAGFPALAIQWGAIGDVGMAFEFLGGNFKEICGTLPQPIHSCMDALDCFLRQKNPVVCSWVLAGVRHSERSGKS